MIPDDAPTSILVNHLLNGYQELLQKCLILCAFLDHLHADNWRQHLDIQMKAGSGSSEALQQFAPLRKAAQAVLLGQAETLLDFPKPPLIQ
ncbi:MAG: hypothetical protein WA738_06155 [Candidatus Angelobacter sp.]